jgi:hypothetical protein
MRIIASGFVNDVTEDVLLRLIKEFGVKFCEYYYEVPNKISDACDAHGTHHLNIQKGNYVDDWNQITPLNEQLIEGMSYCETVVLRMLDRNNLWLSMEYEQRKQLYYKHLRYWNHVLVKKHINLCLFTGIPHGSFDYVIYELCKYHQVPVLLLSSPSLIMHTVFVTDDWMQPSKALEKRFKELLRLKNEGNLPSFNLSEKYQAHYIKQTSVTDDPTPYYMAPKLLNSLLIKPPSFFTQLAFLLLRAALPTKWSRWRDNLIDMVRYASAVLDQREKSRKIKSIYYNNSKEVDLKSAFIYVPLQLQPECTTSPMAGAYVDQLLMVQQLAAHLPPGVLVYVKEYPVQFDYGCVSRSMDFYNQLLQIPAVRFVPENTSTFLLIDKCVAVATGTGTAGWEAIFRGKPYLMFGHHVYQYAPGVYPISSDADCAHAVDRIFDKKETPQLEDLRIFLLAFEQTATDADAVGYRIAVSPYPKELHVQRLTNAFAQAIREKFPLHDTH